MLEIISLKAQYPKVDRELVGEVKPVLKIFDSTFASLYNSLSLNLEREREEIRSGKFEIKNSKLSKKTIAIMVECKKRSLRSNQR